MADPIPAPPDLAVAAPDPAPLREAARRLAAQARALEAMARAGTDDLALRAARDELLGIEAVDLPALLAPVDATLAAEQAGRRARLARQLKDACAAQGLDLVVLTREPLELRLPPLGVTVDVDADQADLVFGRERLERVPARAGAILEARARALAGLEGKAWDPLAFHRALQRAWAATPGPEGWKELTQVLPLLVLALQDERFLREPSARNFRPYSRAALCYDLWRLRRDRALAADGLRLSLGPATGAATRDKRRVLWLEDDQGRGQYYLTLRFVPEAEGAQDG